MKRPVAILLCCLLLAGCGILEPTPTIAPSAPPQVRFTIYTPNDNADGFNTAEIAIDTLSAQNVINALISEQVLNSDIAVNSEAIDGSCLLLDFNSAFRDQLVTYGTAGELMMVGSVVNTFLSVYDVETVMFTVDGEILESGHVIYDFPLGFYE